jgi:glycosyltransferase involved in cell wall biosynthesis
VIANSDGLQQLARASDPFPVEMIPNGVNTTKFLPGTARSEEGVFRVLAVGRLHEQKNHAFALRVLADVRARIPQRLEYHVVGDGPFRPNLEKLVEQLDLVEQVIWHGWTPREKLAEIYRSCDCLLHPTLYEGMPNVVLEAMAAGLPVVASDVPGNSQVVRDGQTGYLRGLDAESAFSDALTKLAGDLQLGQRFGRTARHIVESEYSWDSVSSRYLNIFAPLHKTGVAPGYTPT